MKEKIMNVMFLEDNVKIEFAGKTMNGFRDQTLSSLKDEMIPKGFIVGNKIDRQDVGDFIYYQFYYFDGERSRNIRFQVPKKDFVTRRQMEDILFHMNQEFPEMILDAPVNFQMVKEMY